MVRYSAAKGLGRIASRLPLAYAEEVVDAMISSLDEETFEPEPGNFKPSTTTKDSTWHGTCLALAELCRRGALLPAKLGKALPYVVLVYSHDTITRQLIEKALQFDLKKGTYSIGTHVRDAACYVMWSVLRCYTTDVLEQFSVFISSTLLVVSMFDREISVRRAASAAFQEGVGRHPDAIFAHGLSIITIADFVSVGQRRMAFLEVAPAVFAYVGLDSIMIWSDIVDSRSIKLL